ncbi:unnamed protein product [marine sediment metagenome]|uniref:Uncharacterized protein n=1 Tax=marine sediment metagenome TaxID=412755 RepID=X0Z950_9ZZZZ
MSVDKRIVMESKGSYYVSVPADWVKRHGLKKGDRFRLYYSDTPVLTAISFNNVLKLDGFTAERILQIFGSSLYFSLPMTWCRRYNVTDDSTLLVEKIVENGTLLYSIEKEGT